MCAKVCVCVCVCVCQFINSMSEVSMIIGGFSRSVSLCVCHQLNVSSDRNSLSVAEEGSTFSGFLISNWKIGFAFDFCCAGSGCGHAISSRGVCSSSALSLHHGQCFNTLPTFPDDHKCFLLCWTAVVQQKLTRQTQRQSGSADSANLNGYFCACRSQLANDEQIKACLIL